MLRIRIPSRHSLFPYTTLFRSGTRQDGPAGQARDDRRRWPRRPAPGARDLAPVPGEAGRGRSEDHTSELQSLRHLVCRLLLEKKKKTTIKNKKIQKLTVLEYAQ